MGKIKPQFNVSKAQNELMDIQRKINSQAVEKIINEEKEILINKPLVLKRKKLTDQTFYEINDKVINQFDKTNYGIVKDVKMCKDASISDFQLIHVNGSWEVANHFLPLLNEEFVNLKKTQHEPF